MSEIVFQLFLFSRPKLINYILKQMSFIIFYVYSIIESDAYLVSHELQDWLNHLAVIDFKYCKN